jgi:TorA maturation chaperone TorD
MTRGVSVLCCVVNELLPYYSHYLAGCLMGKPLSNLRDDIRAMGLESQDTQKDPTDHIAGV